MRLSVAAALWLLAWAAPAAAHAPGGTATGYYVDRNGERIELRHARAVLVDEATSGRPREGEVHLLLTERPAPADALDDNGNPRRAIELADRGELRGVMIEFDARDGDELRVFELDRLREEFDGRSRTIDAERVWREFSLGPSRFAARLDTGPTRESTANPEAAFAFDAPLDHDPMVRILTGAEARDSEFVRTAVAVHDALLRGDLDTARRLSTRAVAVRAAPDRPLNAAERQFLQDILAEMRTPTRIVVRRRSATLVAGDETSSLSLNFALEDGQWRVGD